MYFKLIGIKGNKFPVLWSGITYSVLGALVNSTCYIRKIVHCAIKQSGKVPHKMFIVHLNISICFYKAHFYCIYL